MHDTQQNPNITYRPPDAALIESYAHDVCQTLARREETRLDYLNERAFTQFIRTLGHIKAKHPEI